MFTDKNQLSCSLCIEALAFFKDQGINPNVVKTATYRKSRAMRWKNKNIVSEEKINAHI